MFRPDTTLNFSNAKRMLETGVHAIANGQTVIDLGDVATVDSAAVATLIDVFVLDHDPPPQPPHRRRHVLSTSETP